MNFNDFKIFLEKINVPPHMPEQWWTNTLSKAKELESQFIGKQNLIKKYDELADEIGFESIDNIYYNLPNNFRRMLEGVEYAHVSKLSELMKEYSDLFDVKGLNQDIITKARNRIDMISYYNLDFNKFIELWSYYKKGSSEDKGVSDFEHALEMSENNQIVLDLKKFFDSILEYIKTLDDGVHPNRDGHLMIFNLVRSVLK